MQTLIFFVVKMALLVLALPLALVQAYYRRAWCFYDMPEELKTILAATTGEVKNFITRQSESMNEMKERVRELEQGRAHRPGGDYGAGGGVGELTDLIIKSDGLAQFLKGSSPSVQIAVPSRLLKTAVLSPVPLSSSQPLVQGDRRPEIFFAPQMAMAVRDIFRTVETTSNLIEFTRELSYTNAAAPQGGTTSPDEATEGELKAESAMSFELTTSPVITVAHFIPASRQVLADSAALQAHLEGRLLYGLGAELEDELLNGTGLQGKLNGIVNQAAAFTGGDTNQTALDTIAKGLQQLIASEYTPSHVLMNSADWLSIQLLKDTTGRYLFADPQQATQPRLFGKPVVLTNSLAAGTWVVIDAPRAGFIAMREEANVRIAEQHSDYFTRNLVAILAELRVALCITNTAAMVSGNISYAG